MLRNCILRNSIVICLAIWCTTNRAEAQFLQPQEIILRLYQSREQQFTSRREMLKKCESDRQELIHRRAIHNIEADQRHFRDHPEPHRVASGAALNYLVAQFGPNLESVDFAQVKLDADELQSIRLQTVEGVTSTGLKWSFDSRGRIRWPEELRLTELNQQRTDVEDAFDKLRQLDRQQLPADTQLKRVQKEITSLRMLAGYVLRVKKSDDIGADSSRAFLKHLDCQIVKLRTDTNHKLQLALNPEAQSATELMQHIARHNLRFAPCDDPTATAYRALHNHLAEVHRDLQRPTASLHAAK